MLGAVELYASDWIPEGTGLCNNSTLQTASNTALYSLFGNVYGGNVTNFALPDLRGAAPLPGMHYAVRLTGIFPMRD